MFAPLSHEKARSAPVMGAAVQRLAVPVAIPKSSRVPLGHDIARIGLHEPTRPVAGDVVQRLIVIGDPDPSPGRMVAVHNLQTRFPDQRIELLDSCNLNAVPFGEIIYISAHGSPDSVGGLGPAAFAAKLLDRGLKAGAKIDLKACSSAVVGDSYVVELEAEIWQQSNHKKNVLIQGYTSTHVITETGGSLAKDPSLNVGAKRQEYLDIIAEHKSEWQQATLYVKDALAKKLPLAEIAKNVAAMTDVMFKKLYAHNPTVAKSYEQARDTSPLNEYLRAMDPIWGSPYVLNAIREQERARWSTSTPSYIA